jgi:hypothetical protein
MCTGETLHSSGVSTYVAYQGVVYKVSDSFLWRADRHWMRHTAGKDYSSGFEFIRIILCYLKGIVIYLCRYDGCDIICITRRLWGGGLAVGEMINSYRRMDLFQRSNGGRVIHSGLSLDFISNLLRLCLDIFWHLPSHHNLSYIKKRWFVSNCEKQRSAKVKAIRKHKRRRY